MEEFAESLSMFIKSQCTKLLYHLLPFQKENVYHATLFTLFTLATSQVHVEVSSSRGRADIIVETSRRIIVIECKVKRSTETCLEQIERQGYAEQYLSSGKEILLMGVSAVAGKIELGWKTKRPE